MLRICFDYLMSQPQAPVNTGRSIPDTDYVNIKLAEYNALRAEIMYFVDEEMKAVALCQKIIMTEIIAIPLKIPLQASGVFETLAKQIDGVFIVACSAIFPILTILLCIKLYFSSLKVAYAAAYIDKEINKHLKQKFPQSQNDSFFEWDKYKGLLGGRSFKTATHVSEMAMKWLPPFIALVLAPVITSGLIANNHGFSVCIPISLTFMTIGLATIFLIAPLSCDANGVGDVISKNEQFLLQLGALRLVRVLRMVFRI